jgi:hypothetical protein
MAMSRIRKGISAFGGLVLIGAIAILVAWALSARVDARPAAAPGGAAPAAAPAADPRVAAPAAAADPSIVQVADPAGEISARISRATGLTCFVRSNSSRPITDGTELDKQIASAGGTGDRWLEVGRQWIGSTPDSAATAFAATWAGQRPDATLQIWIQLTRNGSDMGLELYGRRTPAGAVVWTAGDIVAPSNVCTN